MMWILVGYIALFVWLGWRRYEACLTQSGDSAFLDCAFYNTLHGNIFWQHAANNSYFEAHPEPILFFFVPFYAIAPGMPMLIFLQTLCIAVSAIPVFLVGRKVLGNEAGGVAIAFALLFFPSIVAQNVGQVHTVIFALPFLVFAFYFFHEDRYWPFVAMLALTSLGKETFPLTAAMFAPYALWKRRQWRWVVTSLVVPIGLLAFDLIAVRGHYARGQQYLALQYFPGMGDSLGAFAKTFLTRPDIVAGRLFTARNALYVAMLTGGVAFVLPFLSKEALFLVPELFLNLVSSNDGMKVVIYLYNCEVGAFLVIAALFSIVKLQRWLQVRLGAGQYGVILAACVAVSCLSNWWQWFNPAEYQFDYARESRRRAFSMIPPDDSLVAGPGQILAHLAHRKLLADEKMIALFSDQMFNYNWVLFDMNYQRPILGEFVPREQLMAYGTNTAYEVVFAENNIYALRRKERIPPEKVTPIRYTSDEPLLRRMR